MSLFDDDEIKKYLKQAVRVAQNSPDPSTQCGAIIVNPFDRTVLAKDCNRPVDVTDTEAYSGDRAHKLARIEHAERGAVYDAARAGRGTLNAVMFGTWVACPDCAKAIVRSGIREVWTLQMTQDETPVRWWELVGDGLAILARGGVRVGLYGRMLSSAEEDYSIRFDGEKLTL